MGTKLLTFLLLGLYLFVPPVLCWGEDQHVAIEAGRHSHTQVHAATDGTEICEPHGNHPHGACVDAPILAEANAQTLVSQPLLRLYESYPLPVRHEGTLIAEASNSFFTDNLLVSLHATVLLI